MKTIKELKVEFHRTKEPKDTVIIFCPKKVNWDDFPLIRILFDIYREKEKRVKIKKKKC